MATITSRTDRNGKSRHTVRIRTRGHVETKTFATKTAAKQWAQAREVELREKPHLAGSESHKRTLGAAIDKYLADYLPEKSASMVSHQTRQLAWWRDRYGHLTLDLIQAPLLVEARDELRRQPKERGEGTLSPASVNRHLAALSVVLSMAHREWHWISVNPMDGVSKLKEDNARTRYLDDKGPDSELARLLAACRESEAPLLYPVVLTLLTTGGRAQEVLGLQWRDVDLENGTVTFRHTKNGDVRTVALGPEVVDLLTPREGRPNELVFPGPRSGKPLDIRSAWETALRRAGIEDFRIHDLRHSAASYLAMEGSTLAELAGVLGHRTLAMVKRYSHLSPDHVAKVSTRIADRIGRNGGGA